MIRVRAMGTNRTRFDIAEAEIGVWVRCGGYLHKRKRVDHEGGLLPDLTLHSLYLCSDHM